MKTLTFLAMIFLFVWIGGCDSSSPPKSGVTLKISVSAAGEVTVDGKPATLESLPAQMDRFKLTNGIILFHREITNGVPHSNAKRVEEFAMARRIFMRLSEKPDFSDIGG